MTQYSIETWSGLIFDLWLDGPDKVQYGGFLCGKITIDNLSYVETQELYRVWLWVSKSISRYELNLKDVYEPCLLSHETIQDMLDPHYIATDSYITRIG